ncbi:MAG: virulence factor [Candidatus Nanopelagicales bacterium]
MTEIQITKWRDIPSMIVAKDGEDQVKISLPARFQEAIDEAAMRLGEADADAYMDGWTRDSWAVAGSVTSAAEALAAELETKWTPAALAVLLDSYGAVQQ